MLGVYPHVSLFVLRLECEACAYEGDIQIRAIAHLMHSRFELPLLFLYAQHTIEGKQGIKLGSAGVTHEITTRISFFVPGGKGIKVLLLKFARNFLNTRVDCFHYFVRVALNPNTVFFHIDVTRH